MGYYTDGVTWYWHDDNANYGGLDPHVAGTPHNIDEFLAAFPAVCGEMQDPAGLKTKAKLAYLISQNTVIGGKTGVDSFAQTTWTETASKYIFLAPGKTLTMRTPGAVPNVTYNWGNKHGTNPLISGSRGVKIFQDGAFNVPQNLYAYGSLIESDAGINLNDNMLNNTIELGGCMLNGATGQMGAQGSGIYIFNTIWAGSGTALWSTVAPKESDNIIGSLGGSPSTFLQTSANARELKGVSFIGTPTLAYVRLNGGAPGWIFSQIRWGPGDHISILNAIDPEGLSGSKELEEFHFRVHDPAGFAIPGIPISIVSDHPDFGFGGSYVPFGPPGYLTNDEGDIVWTDTQYTGEDNRLPVRAWGGSGGGVTIKNERVYTVYVNDPNDPAWDRRYPSTIFNMSAPGRDMKAGVALPYGGDFYRIITIPICLGAVNWPDRWVEEQASI